MTRSVSVCVAIAGLLAAAEAHADTGMLPNGATIVWDRVYITEDGTVQEPSTPDAMRMYLNLAHCVCSQAGAGEETQIAYDLRLSADTNTNRPGELWVGTQCDDDLQRPTSCRSVGSIPDIDVLVTREERVEFPLYDVINGADNTAPCRETEGDAFAWVLVDSDGDATYDYFANQSLGNVTTTPAAQAVKLDTQAPPVPTNFEGGSAEAAIALSWDPPESRATDVFYYQALCARPDGTPALDSPLAPRYQTVRTLCGLATDIAIEEVELVGADPTPADLIEPLAQLDPAYVCGESTDPTATGMLIEGLENDVPYNVVLVSIDLSGNVAGVHFTTTITPQPATDFWEDLHDRGSSVEGGFCLLAETYGDGGPLTRALRAFRDETLAGSALGRALTRAYYGVLAPLGAYVHGSLALQLVAAVVLAPLVAVALLWHVLTLPGLLLVIGALVAWRRRRRPLRITRARRFALAAALVIVPATAGAQGTPYWQEDADAADADGGEVTWHVGVRVGPYVPAIDKQFGTEPGPYEEMFGGYQILPVIDLDRIVWRGVGHVGLGGSIGYMQKSAKAWADGSIPGDPMRERSPGDENTFRLLPLALTGVYRFTWLDDNYGIPVVPYARGGLSYYLWWIRTNGDTSSACWDGTRDPMCDSDKAIGGTFGLQGALGVSIRAERIDPSAAISMRASGIMHAGFYAELSAAWVNGFGRTDDSGKEIKLSVGDTTWFAGVDFEF